jgi:hypothetical protein
MLDLHARALIALHRIYECSDVMSYTFQVFVLEALAERRREKATIASNRAAELEAWLRRQLDELEHD